MTASSIKRPSSTDFNEAADYWRYTVDANVIPADSRTKTTWITWAKSGYQDNPISEEQHEKWKKENAFKDGMAVITGLIRRGPHKGLYLNCIDCDNKLAIDNFYSLNGEPATLKHIANVFLVEQHLDNVNKCHIFFYSTIPLVAKTSSANTVGKEKLDNNELPAYEVKSTSKTIVYCTPSFHQNGKQYEFIGSSDIPPTLNETQVNNLMRHLDQVHKNYGMSYLEYADSASGKSLIPITELKKPDFEILEGNNRHEALLRIIESRIVKLRNEVPLEEIKELCYVWNQQHCKAPLDDKEFEKQWEDAQDFVARKDAERLEQERLEHEQRVQRLLGKKLIGVSQLPQPEIPARLRNDYFEYLVWCAQKEVKQENALIRQIDLTILSAYGSDPSNLGIMAPTSTGKSWPVNKCVKYAPVDKKEVRVVGKMSPKVLVREKGVLVDKDGNPIGREVRKLQSTIKTENAKKHFDQVNKLREELEILTEGAYYIIDLSNMVLIFLEPPDPELWDLLKPILSHDSWETEYPYVDTLGHGIEVKRVVTRGWPACIFCSAKDESRWEVWPEIESRFAISSPNIIKLKFQEGNTLIWQSKWLPRAVKQKLIISDEEVKLGRSCFLYLKHQILQYKEKTDSPVWAPFGEYVGAAFPADRGQDNRAFNRFTTILNTIALCKAHLRYKLLFGKEELIIPSLQDLRETLHVLQNLNGLPPHKLNFYKEYIYPLWANNGCIGSLKGKEIVDSYNHRNPDKRHPMNTENLRNNYLKELVNHNYLEQEQDDSTKAKRYVYTPLIRVEDRESQEPTKREEEKEQSLTSLTVDQIINNLQYSKLILPKSHKGIPENWLSLQISQLYSALSTFDQLTIVSPDGKVVSTEEFVKEYEKDGDKLTAYISSPEVNKAF